MACRSEVVTDEGAFHKFIFIAALHTATEYLACPLTLSLRQATSNPYSSIFHQWFHRSCYLAGHPMARQSQQALVGDIDTELCRIDP